MKENDLDSVSKNFLEDVIFESFKTDQQYKNKVSILIESDNRSQWINILVGASSPYNSNTEITDHESMIKALNQNKYANYYISMKETQNKIIYNITMEKDTRYNHHMGNIFNFLWHTRELYYNTEGKHSNQLELEMLILKENDFDTYQFFQNDVYGARKYFYEFFLDHIRERDKSIIFLLKHPIKGIIFKMKVDF